MFTKRLRLISGDFNSRICRVCQRRSPIRGDELSDEPGGSLSESRHEVIPALSSFQRNPKDSSHKSKLAACAAVSRHRDIYFTLMSVIKG